MSTPAHHVVRLESRALAPDRRDLVVEVDGHPHLKLCLKAGHMLDLAQHVKLAREALYNADRRCSTRSRLRRLVAAHWHLQETGKDR